MASVALRPSTRSPSPTSIRANSPPVSTSSSSRPRVSASPPAHLSPRTTRRSSVDKENVGGTLYSAMEAAKNKIGNGISVNHNGNAHYDETTRSRRESSASEDDVEASLRRRNVPRSPRSARSPPVGVATLPTIVAQVPMDSSRPDFTAHSPPPAPSAGLAHASDVPAPRRRRSSSIKIKPPPGVVPTKAVDWEIPRKAFHSSIGEYRSAASSRDGDASHEQEAHG